MALTTIGRVIELTESVLEDTENDEYKFKLRTAIQLLEIIEERHNAASDVLADCDLDEQVRANLQELGYLE
jgi:hypothetical protein